MNRTPATCASTFRNRPPEFPRNTTDVVVKTGIMGTIKTGSCTSFRRLFLSMSSSAEMDHTESALDWRIQTITGQSLPIFIQVVWSFLISVRILMRRMESLRRRLRVLPLGRERRNISMTC